MEGRAVKLAVEELDLEEPAVDPEESQDTDESEDKLAFLRAKISRSCVLIDSTVFETNLGLEIFFVVL